MNDSDPLKPSTIPKDERNILASFYIAGGLRELIPIYPLYAIMFGAHGVGPFELSMLFVIWAAVGMLLEVPSGALADRFSKKWLIVISGVMKSAAFVSWYLYQDFWGYALGFVLWGAGSSLRSGAFEALLYELLEKWEKQTRFAFHHGRIRALATITVMLGEASGGLLILYGYDVVLLVSATVPILVSIPFMIYVVDVSKATEPQSYGSYLESGVKETLGDPTILFILLLSTFLLTVHGIFDEYVPPLLVEHGFEIWLIPFIAIPIFLAQALGQFLAGRFYGLSFPVLVWLMVLGALTLIPAGFVPGVVSVIGTTIFFFLFGLAGTLLETRLQDQISGDARATVTSMIGLGDSFGAIFWFIFFGIVAESYNLSTGTIALAVATLLICFVAQLIARRYRLTIMDEK